METIEKEITNSSQVSKVKYNTESKVLTVTFKTGKSYEYYEVSQFEWEGLLSAESVGKYLNSHIKPNHSFKAI